MGRSLQCGSSARVIPAKFARDRAGQLPIDCGKFVEIWELYADRPACTPLPYDERAAIEAVAQVNYPIVARLQLLEGIAPHRTPCSTSSLT